MADLIHIKSKFDAEFRRISISVHSTYSKFREIIESLHFLYKIPFTICYTSAQGDLLPITNEDNLRKALNSSLPCLRLLVQRKGESWEEKYGYGTDTVERKRKGLSMLIPAINKSYKRIESLGGISNPLEDFRHVSAIVDVHIVPPTHRRVRLCKHGSDRPLGFYIKTGVSKRFTSQGLIKSEGIFISRLAPDGLAESTGLLGVDDEVVEVNGIDISGKTIDQVTDMMVANANNLIITIKPAHQPNVVVENRNRERERLREQRASLQQSYSSAGSSVNKRHLNNMPYNNSYSNFSNDNDDSGEDEIIDHTKSTQRIKS